MTESFEFERVDALLPLAIGQPGERTFYVQARIGNRSHNFKCEKGQVGALGEYVQQLADVSGVGGSAPETAAVAVDTVEWPVGEVSIALNEATARIIILFREFSLESLDDGDSDADTTDHEGSNDGATAQISLTPQQARAFAAKAQDLVNNGRPRCFLCGRPIDSDGHFCPRMN